MSAQLLRSIFAAIAAVAVLTACTGVDGRPLAEALAVDAGPAKTRLSAPPPSSEPQRETPMRDDAKPSLGGNALLDALAYSPAGTSTLLFMDWAAVKNRLGVARSSDSADEAARRGFAQALRTEPITSMYGMQYFLDHAANWGWDALDLAWEASLFLEAAAPIYVLRFEDGKQLAAIRSVFEARDFSREAYGDAQVYSHAMDPSLDRIRTTEFAILNVALIEAENVLVLSSSGDAVRAVLDAVESEATLAKDDATRAAVRQLGGVDAGIVDSGAEACLSFEVNPLANMLGESDISVEAMQEALERVMPVRPQSMYTALAMGVTQESAMSGDPVWKVVMHYPTEDAAQADLPQRRIIAEEGMSVVRELANQELFAVRDAAVHGQEGMLWLSSTQARPSFLVEMYYRRDSCFFRLPLMGRESK